jgi:hypothetical protein
VESFASDLLTENVRNVAEMEWRLIDDEFYGRISLLYVWDYHKSNG